MITKRETKLSELMITAQVLYTVLLFLTVTVYFYDWAFTFVEKTFFVCQITLIWGYLLYKFRLGIIFRADSFSSMLRGYLVTVCLGSALIFIELEFFSFFQHMPNSLSYMAFFAILNLLSLVVFKFLFYHFMRFLRRKGYNSRYAIIIADKEAIPFIDSFIASKDWGYRLKAIVSPNSFMVKQYDEVLIINTHEELKQYITTHTVDDVFYCIPIEDKSYDLEQIIRELDEIGVTLHIMQHDYLASIEHKLPKDISFDNSFVTYQTVPLKYYSLKLKDSIDFVFSLMVLILFAPLFLLISILIKFEDGGPIIFSQERIGLNGRRFKCYKFRSMVINAEAQISKLQHMNESDGPTFKIENDPRITRIGRLLRKTSLDELPQFYNVLKGEMSVVGPRPPLLTEVQQYERTQLRRLSMKPGITCVWQVWGRNQVPFEEWMRMDLDYIDNWSLYRDFKIILATIGVVLRANGR